MRKRVWGTSALQLNPYATLAWSLLSKIPEVRFLLRMYGTFTLFLSFTFQTLLQLIQRDENVETLLETIRDAFEFAEETDTLRSIKPESKQAKILGGARMCL